MIHPRGSGMKPDVLFRQDTGADGSRHCVWEFRPGRELLETLLRDLFENHYESIVFGPCIEGAVFEYRVKSPPRRISYMDGYLTVDLDDWHFHLCIGKHRGDAQHPCPPELARWRRCARVMLLRIYQNPPVEGHAPVSYSMALLNGRNEQMMTFYLPNPFFDERYRVLEYADWTKLALWNHIRTSYLGLEADPGPFADLK